MDTRQSCESPLLEIISVTTDSFSNGIQGKHPVEIDTSTYQSALQTYRQNSQLLIARYQHLLAHEPPISSGSHLAVHETWRYAKQDVITRLSDLESWFVDIDEPPPQDDGSDDYEDLLDVWIKRMTSKLTRHVTHYCPPQIVSLIERPTSYRVKQQRYARLAFWRNHYQQAKSRIE